MTELSDRLRAAGAALQALREPLVAGEPWPLSANYGHEPESTWGPREVLAHVEEMLTYWVEELERVRAGSTPPGSPVPFGRVATDASRLDRIDRARQQDVGVQLDEIRTGLDGATAFADGLDDEERQRVGLHPSRGEITIDASIERFLVSHLEDHIVQLREILGRDEGVQQA